MKRKKKSKPFFSIRVNKEQRNNNNKNPPSTTLWSGVWSTKVPSCPKYQGLQFYVGIMEE